MKLLIGYDGSVCAERAMEDLSRAGLPGNVEALVICVADVCPITQTSAFAEVNPEVAAQARLQAETAINEARTIVASGADRLHSTFPHWQIHSDVVANSPYWGLIQKAQEWRPDLLLVGSHGRSALERAFMGSVSQHAILYASCNTRVGRCSEQAVRRQTDRPVRILVGWDGSDGATLAVRLAASREWAPGTLARIVTALDQRLSGQLAMLLITGSRARRQREELREGAWLASAPLRERGVDVEELILIEGDPRRLLLQEAERFGADTIFVGAKGLSRIERVLLGSVSTAVATRAPCSVEIVRWRPFVSNEQPQSSGEPHSLV